jgi:hypothetical protein
MARGGFREGAGSKSKWLAGKTMVVRVPQVLSEEVLRLAGLLDEGRTVDDVTKSKYLDLSGISISYIEGKPAILIEDLLSVGFKIRPIKLVDALRKQIDRQI